MDAMHVAFLTQIPDLARTPQLQRGRILDVPPNATPVCHSTQFDESGDHPFLNHPTALYVVQPVNLTSFHGNFNSSKGSDDCMSMPPDNS